MKNKKIGKTAMNRDNYYFKILANKNKFCNYLGNTRRPVAEMLGSIVEIF